MKVLVTFIAILFPLFVRLKEEVVDETLYQTDYKLYLSNNETYTVIDIVDYSNITRAWGLQSPMNITWFTHQN